jgi:KDO2-lipid IV(A) lauroyltransferase
MALLPLKYSQLLGGFFGGVIYRLKNSRSYSVSKKNIELCFSSLSHSEQETLLKHSLIHTGMSYAEMGMSWLWSTNRSLNTISSVKGEELLVEAFASNSGVLIIAPHIGNWEVLNLYASRNYDLTVLYKQPKIKFFDWLIKKMRSRLGGSMAPANASGVRLLMKKLRSNKVVAILPDQEPALGSGKFIPFFSRQAYTMTLLSQLAAKTNCKVISGVAIREEGGKGFAIEFSEVDTLINSKDIEVSLAILNKTIERIASKNPEQYQWEYKRFKKSPEGLDKLY